MGTALVYATKGKNIASPTGAKQQSVRQARGHEQIATTTTFSLDTDRPEYLSSASVQPFRADSTAILASTAAIN